MNIMPVSINKIAFRAAFQNPDGKIVHLSEEGIRQAKLMANIRQTINDAMKECPEEVLSKAPNSSITGEKLFFTIDKSGKCIISAQKPEISEKEVPNIKYAGKIDGDSDSFSKKEAREIHAFELDGIDKGQMGYYSDECGSIRANGMGMKFAKVNKDGEIEIYRPEVFPE